MGSDAASVILTSLGASSTRIRDVINRLLRMPPYRAARQIVDAVRRRRGRLVVTSEARALDLLVRIAPERYWSLVRRMTGGRSDGP